MAILDSWPYSNASERSKQRPIASRMPGSFYATTLFVIWRVDALESMNTLYLIGGPDTQELSADIVGSKAANLSRMAKMGLPVPPAFVLPTGLCSGVNHNRHA